jgi:rhodanese-related sulfurtransferase
LKEFTVGRSTEKIKTFAFNRAKVFYFWTNSHTMYRFPLLLLLCCSLSFASYSQADTTLLSPDAFEKAIAGVDAQLVDVRTAEEYKKGHLKNSLLADWKKRDEFEAGTKKLDPSKPVYLFCAAGARSHAAAAFLRGKGFKQVYELDGGFNKWKEEKKPVQD